LPVVNVDDYRNRSQKARSESRPLMLWSAGALLAIGGAEFCCEWLLAGTCQTKPGTLIHRGNEANEGGRSLDSKT